MPIINWGFATIAIELVIKKKKKTSFQTFWNELEIFEKKNKITGQRGYQNVNTIFPANQSLRQRI